MNGSSPIARSRRRVLRLGYGVMLALLALASFEAYRIQQNASSHHLDLYRKYTQQDEALASLRYSVWLAGNRVREYFIDTRPETAARLKQKLKDLKVETDRSLERLRQLNAESEPIRATIQEFWDVLVPVADSMASATQAEKYSFVEQEIAPRRSVLYTSLRELLLAEQTEVQRRESELAGWRWQSGRRLVLVLGLCMAFALIVARFSIAHSDGLERTSERQYDALEAARQELRELSARLVDIEEEGRKRLARELHDGIGQSLAILQIEISNTLGLPPERWAEGRARLARARELAQATVQSVRGMSLTLRPALLDDLGLVPALEWLLEDFMRRSSVACEFHASPVEVELPDPVKTCVYRVVQEAIHNCEKHANATRVVVTMSHSPGTIDVQVNDNGRGFKVEDGVAASRQRGLGIVVMRERAERLGGNLLIDSSTGRGTTLRLSVPLLAAAPPSRVEAAPVKS